ARLAGQRIKTLDQAGKILTLASRLKTLTRSFFILALVLAGNLPLSAATQVPSLESYRKYALTHEGDVAAGRALFNDEQRLACSKCHSVDGRANKAGPDLVAAGDAFGRWDLVDAVLQPSATIAPGYGTVIVETKSGDVLQGVLKQSTEAGLQLMGADGQLRPIATTEIKEKS